MKEYLERFLTAIETIAACMKSGAPAMAGATTTAAPAAETIDLGMPGAEQPAKGSGKRGPKAAALAPAAAPAPLDPPAGAAKPVLLADVAEHVRKLVATGPDGHKNAVSVLQKFGAKRISEVKQEDFPKVVTAINEILNAKK